MSARRKAHKLAAPVFGFDCRVRKALLPYRDHPLAKALSGVSQAGDQLQLRVLSGGVLLLGLARRDFSLVRASLRIALAHEVATFAKDQLKERVIRSRPRSASGKAVKPRKGHDTAKEKSSFPSGHAGGAFAAAGGFSGELPKYTGLSHAAAAAIGLARLPRNAHYPSDIAAGALVGALSAGLVNALWAVAGRSLRGAR